MTTVARPFAGRRAIVSAEGTRFVHKCAVWVALVLLTLFGLIAVPNFATPGNLDNIVRQAAVLAIVSVGQTFVVVAGGLDLSVGMLMGLVTVLAIGTIGGDPTLIPLVVVMAVAVGLLVGTLTGLGIVVTRVHPLIFTFGMLSILQGLIFIYTDRTIGGAPSQFREIAYGSVVGIPTPLILLLVVVGIGTAVLHSTPFGRYVYAVGSDEMNARRAGVAINRVKVATYAISGVTAAIAGLLLAARLGSGYTLAGSGFELSAIVAVVLGGTALSGGRGGVLGTLAGVLLLTMIGNVLNLLSISSFVQLIVKGVIVVTAVSLYTVGRRT